jgi:hypothetical protein
MSYNHVIVHHHSIVVECISHAIIMLDSQVSGHIFLGGAGKQANQCGRMNPSKTKVAFFLLFADKSHCSSPLLQGLPRTLLSFSGLPRTKIV